MRTTVVLTMSPGLLVLGIHHRDQRRDVAFVLAGPLVLRAVGTLEGLQAQAWHANDAKHEHQQPEGST